MTALDASVAAGTTSPVAGPPRAGDEPAVLAQRWPMLATAMRQYEAHTAEAFTKVAYDAVEHGLIRLDERRRLGRVAAEMGIREFDAQLLIACAVRQWVLDHRYSSRPSPDAPRLSFEYKSWTRAWAKFAIMASTAAMIDAILLYHWLRS